MPSVLFEFCSIMFTFVDFPMITLSTCALTPPWTSEYYSWICFNKTLADFMPHSPPLITDGLVFFAFIHLPGDKVPEHSHPHKEQ